MSKAKQTQVEAFLARISRGSVPVGGFYWVDPRAVRQAAPARPAEAPAVTSTHEGARGFGGRFAKWWPLRRTGELS
jgi:hypothetical protein